MSLSPTPTFLVLVLCLAEETAPVAVNTVGNGLLKDVGLITGSELVLASIALAFRHHYDGVTYPNQVPGAFFAIGAAVIIAVTEFYIPGVITELGVLIIALALVMAAGLMLFHYFWFIYPTDHSVFSRSTDDDDDD